MSALLWAGQAMAQDSRDLANANKQTSADPTSESSKEGPSSDSDILVTGSNIRGNTNTSTSLSIISRGDFERSGFLDAGQAVRSIPQNFSGGYNVENYSVGVAEDQANLNQAIASSPNLRALGSGATLTLLNGGRLTSAGSGLSVDMSLIPTAAIDRIEVLADGASSTYGADAVAGVVNIITKRSYDGVETRALYGGAQGGMATYNGSILAGGSAGRFSGVVSAEYLRQGSLSADDRAQAKNIVMPYTLIPLQKRASFMAAGTFDVTSNVQLFADGFYTHAQLDSDLSNSIYAAHGVNKTDQFLADAGLSAKIGNSWHATLTGTLSRNNPEQVSSGVLTSSGRRFSSSWDRISMLKSVQALADGELFSLPAGAVKASIGGSYRYESTRSTFDPEASAHRDVVSVFGELAIPLVSPEQSVPFVHRLSLTTSGHWDRYGGGIGSAFVPKFAGAWEVSDSIELRGSYSRSYRAPNLNELSSNYVAYLTDAIADNSGGTTRILWVQGSGRNLHPEKSDNMNFQLRYHPSQIKGLDLSVGYYRFVYKNRIADPDPNTISFDDIRNTLPIMIDRTPSAAQVQALIQGASFFGGGNPAGVTAIVDSRLVNLSKTEISGLEGRVAYAANIGASAISFSSNINYIDKFVDYVTAGASPTSRVGTTFSPPHWRARTLANWEISRFSTQIAWNYVGSYEDNRSPTANIPVDSWNTVDLGVTIHLGNNRERDTRLNLVATNVFNARPPFIAATSSLVPANWDPTNASIVGRFLSIEFVKKW
ncbi:TonB-dependent receptor [Sphingobium sp. LB126]|uniref:TonB-dependent receptor plug domain-containing protein n=1 Tax=Sphingobium sp. LB126 TaxID=1983755 RepID=UPI0018D509F4|nr:TonB-dependent receptor [Sphingobium sp. LB126]